MSDFEERFPESAKRLRTSLPAILLVRDAAKAGVTFAGYAEDGPLKTSVAYQQGGRVYITRHSTNPERTMGYFLFELTNAMNKTRLQEIAKQCRQRKISENEFVILARSTASLPKFRHHSSQIYTLPYSLSYLDQLYKPFDASINKLLYGSIGRKQKVFYNPACPPSQNPGYPRTRTNVHSCTTSLSSDA